MLVTRLWYLVLLLVLLISCDADQSIVADSSLFSNEVITGSIDGRVIDIENQPIRGARVTLVSGTIIKFGTTDDEGGFIFEDVENSGNSVFISVQADGKFDTYKRFGILEGEVNHTLVKMHAKEVVGSFISTQGGIVETGQGIKLDFPPDAIGFGQGVSYSGRVDVVLTWVDPSAEDFRAQIVGDITGIDAEGNRKGLTTFGMIQVELLTPNGSMLEVDEGKVVEVKIPVPTSLGPYASSTSSLWSYEESLGYWEEESTVRYESGAYIGTLSHFSSWSVCNPYERIDLSGKINFDLNDDTVAFGNWAIYLQTDLGFRTGGMMSDNGAFRFINCPKDEKFELIIFDNCANKIYSEEFGPFREDTYLGEFIETNTNEVAKLKGVVWTCDFEPISNAKVSFTQGSDLVQFSTNTDGEFETTIDLCAADEMIVSFQDPITLNTANLRLYSVSDALIFQEVVICEFPYYSYFSTEHNHEDPNLEYLALSYDTEQDTTSGKTITKVSWYNADPITYTIDPVLEFWFEDTNDEPPFEVDVLHFYSNFAVDGGEGRMIAPGDLKLNISKRKKENRRFIQGDIYGQVAKLHDNMGGVDSVMINYNSVFRAH